MEGWLRCSLLLLPLLLPTALSQSPPRIVCFYENWARYRAPLGRFLPANIPPHLCTHIHYVGASVDQRSLQLGPLDGFADIVTDGYKAVTALREHNPELRVLAVLGSGQRQQAALREAAGTAEKRKQLAEAAVLFLRQHSFDGLDVDWKPPHAADTHAALLEALRAAFEREAASSAGRRLLLSAALTPHPQQLRDNFDLARVTAAVDYSSVLGYRYHESAANVTGHHAPLRSPDGAPSHLAGRNVLSTVETLKQMGADLRKLNLAVPTFGLTFKLADARRAGLYDPVDGPGTAGPITRGEGSLATYEICDKLSRRGWRAARPYPQALGPYAAGGDQWVAYDDEVSLAMKGQFAREAGLGGVAVWTISLDDYRGFCTGQQFPMLRALKAGLLGVTVSHLPTTPAPPTTPAYDDSDIFTCPGNGKYVASDCEHFYFCSGGEAQLLSCQASETYDEALKACRPGGRCTPRPSLSVAGFGPTPTPSPTAAPPPEPTRGRAPARLGVPLRRRPPSLL